MIFDIYIDQRFQILRLLVYKKKYFYMILLQNDEFIFCRSIATVLGLYSFVLSKRSINAQRYDIMKARQRLRDANTVE